MSHYKPYPAYKDSGIKWLGEVPGHWEVKRIRYVAAFTNSNVDKKSYDGQVNVTLCNYTDVYYNEFITSKIPFKPATARRDEIDKFSLRKGDVLITKDSEAPDDIGIPSIVLEDMSGVICGYHLTLIRSTDLATARILHRVFQSHPTKAHFFVEAPGITRYGLSQDAIGDLRICLPPPEERGAIVDFLDRQTARIDALIAKKTRFIELLKEKRQALITHAVTKGLDPNVKMKDSGVEWIGEVPEKWEAVKISHIGKLTKANGGSKQDNVDSGISCIRYGDLYTTHEYIIRKSRSYIEEGKLDEYTAIQYGDALFAASGETFEDIGRSAVNLLKEDACCGGDVIVLKPSKDIDPLFLGYALDSIPSKYQKALMGRGYTVVHIYTEQLRDLIVAVPPSFEQKTIGIALDRQTARIDLIIEKTQRSIDLLRERRSALITAAVTGQIDLRETI